MAIFRSVTIVLKSNLKTTRWFPLLGFILLMWTPLGSLPGVRAAKSVSSCEILEEGKWSWHPLFGDFLPPFWQRMPDALPEVTLTSCWNCGLWLEESFPPSWNPEDLRQTLAQERAKCYQALGMQGEALGAFREIVRHDPYGKPAFLCIQSILEILFQNGNYNAAAGLYQGLDPTQRSLLSPESLYLVAQSLYQKNHDKQARELLELIPPNSAIYPYALYAQAQIDFRNGKVDQALDSIGSLLDRPMEIPVPKMLRELAWLTRARISFQHEKYTNAIKEYRKLSRSRYFLPEALMGMGWCYKALGESAKAVSYFQAVGETSTADSNTWARANLEIAHIYSKDGIHGKAFQIFQEVQQHLKTLVDRHREVVHDEAWLARMSTHILTYPAEDAPGATAAPKKMRTAELKNEMELLLEKESYVSPRMKMLLAVREALDVVHSLLIHLPEQVDPSKKKLREAPFRYPPLEASPPLFEPELTHLLEVTFALLDTEFRLDNTEMLLGLSDPEERDPARIQRLSFYRSALQEMLLPQQMGQDAYATLRQLQSTVRHLPFPLEERNRILDKLLYAVRTLEDTDRTLQRWQEGMEDIRTSGSEPPRLILLKEWMIYVRSLILFRTWSDRSPAVFLLETQQSQTTVPTESLLDNVRGKLGERREAVQKRLAVLLQKEIKNIHKKRLRAFEKSLIKSQLYYAESLLHKQETLLKTIQSAPAD